jgi:hypothetical protein
MLVVSGSITLLSVAISSWLALRQYRLKLKEEERLSTSARTETDIKLVKAFGELMDVANGRSGHVVSEKTVEFLLARKFVSDEELLDPTSVGRKLEAAAVFTLPVGRGAQDAAIAAIATLGARHEVLRVLALQGLPSLKIVRPDLAPEYYEQLAQAGPVQHLPEV